MTDKMIEVPEIEYSVLRKFADDKRCNFKELCDAVRESVEAPLRLRTALLREAAQPDNGWVCKTCGKGHHHFHWGCDTEGWDRPADEELRMSCPMQDQSNCALFSGGRAESVALEIRHSPADEELRMERVRQALSDAGFRLYDDYYLAHGAPLMSEDSHEIIHADTVDSIVRAAAGDEELRRDADPSLLSDAREIVAVLSGEFEEYHGEEDEIGRDLLRRLDAAIAAEKREGS